MKLKIGWLVESDEEFLPTEFYPGDDRPSEAYQDGKTARKVAVIDIDESREEIF
jgi:hypothetical protein